MTYIPKISQVVRQLIDVTCGDVMPYSSDRYPRSFDSVPILIFYYALYSTVDLDRQPTHQMHQGISD